MIIIRETETRTITFDVRTDDQGNIWYGVAVCHTYNGATREPVEKYDEEIGRRMAAARAEQSPIPISKDSIYQTFCNAVRAGHKVTLKDLINDILDRDFDFSKVPNDDIFVTTLYELIDEESARVREEEAAAWAEYQARDLSDEEWVKEATAAGLLDDTGGYIPDYVDYVDYVDYDY